MARHEDIARYMAEYPPMDALDIQADKDLSSFAPSSAGANSPSSKVNPAAVIKQEVRDDYEMTSHQQRNYSPMGSTVRSEKEKRKRSRVTPEQLAELERYFAMDRNPPVARRKEISDQLGMQERQTQIWFQNRRAKAKLQDGKNSNRREITYRRSEIQPSERSNGFKTEVHSLIHEDEPVQIIPCSDLTIGSWRRIATSSANQDLIAYVSDVKRCLNWFIRSGGYGFKMEIPFDSVIDAELTNAGANASLAVFILSRPPNFYLENVASTQREGLLRTWKRCSDWTQGHQATHVLRHTLIGSAAQLAHVFGNFRTNTHVPLRPLANRPESLPPLGTLPVEDADQPTSPYDVPNSHLKSLWQSHGPLSYKSAVDSEFIGHRDVRSAPHSAPATSSHPMNFPPLGSVSASFEPRTNRVRQANPHYVTSISDFHNALMSQSPNIDSHSAQSLLCYDSNCLGADLQRVNARLTLPGTPGYNTSHSSLPQYQPGTNFN